MWQRVTGVAASDRFGRVSQGVARYDMMWQRAGCSRRRQSVACVAGCGGCGRCGRVWHGVARCGRV